MTQASASTALVTSEDEPYVAFEHELCTLLRRARAMSAEMGRQVHPDLDPEAYGLLVGIHDHERVRGSDLAGFFGLSKATVSRQLKVLGELGLVEREPDPVDGRAHVLVLSTEGRQRLESTRSARRGAWHTMLRSWPVGDVRLLADMLARFNVLCEDGLDV
jgi:DNA-binding MarR family transcriptional regulator